MLENESINVKISSTVLAEDKSSMQVSFLLLCHRLGVEAEVNCCQSTGRRWGEEAAQRSSWAGGWVVGGMM